MHSVEDYQRIFKNLNHQEDLLKIEMWSYFTFGMFKRMVRRSDSCPLCRRKVFSNDGATNATNNNNNNNGRIIKIMEMYHHLNQVMCLYHHQLPQQQQTAAAVNAELQRK